MDILKKLYMALWSDLTWTANILEKYLENKTFWYRWNRSIYESV